jgi:integrase/recombinase XerD
MGSRFLVDSHKRLPATSTTPPEKRRTTSPIIQVEQRPATGQKTLEKGLRRGEALGLRLCDLHFLPTSASLGCAIDGPHLHVLPRHNSNHARVKNDKSRTVPVTAGLIALYERYRTERDECRLARESDFVFVNLYRQPLGEPMKLHAANELMDRLSRRLGQTVTPHMLRHTFGTGAAATTTLDVVAELLGHASLQSTQVYLHPDAARQRAAIEAGALSRHIDAGM